MFVEFKELHSFDFRAVENLSFRLLFKTDNLTFCGFLFPQYFYGFLITNFFLIKKLEIINTYTGTCLYRNVYPIFSVITQGILFQIPWTTHAL